jgi:predicted nucleic acid-binding protein
VVRARVAELVRSIVVFPAIAVDDDVLLLRALEVYETDRLDFADAYLVATAERLGLDEIVSFGRALDRVRTVRRVEPGRVPGSR